MKNTNESKKEKKPPMTKKERWLKALLITVAVILALWTVFAICLLTLKLMTYGPDWEDMSDEDYIGEYTTHIDENGTYYVVPAVPKAGFVFYGGGLVEHTAYLPLMEELASRGILCIMPKLTLNLAILDVYAAADIKGEYADKIPPELWYIGGHSLGGVAASKYYSEVVDDYYGLILLASYSNVDVTSAMCVLSIYGSEDGVLNKNKYEDNKVNVNPQLFTEHVIEGANHCGFGAYGHQRGDGEAKITPDEQRGLAADIMAEFILR